MENIEGNKPERDPRLSSSRTRPADEAAPGAAWTQAGAAVSAEWRPGEVLLDVYQVKGILGEGGVGKVYRVRHTGWNKDLAMKSLMPGKAADPEVVRDFMAEAVSWIGLGTHPNIVTCHGIHKLGGIPHIFSECVDGGSLGDWIKDGRLYGGGRAEALARILDIAIQLSWGLNYIHGKNFVHQDVKPKNVMMTPGGVAKVTDFGLARAHALTAGPLSAPDQKQTLRTPGAGSYTREYASPEQIGGQSLTRRTDIWSWAVSVLQMFKGELTWMIGSAAPEVLTNYYVSTRNRPFVPEMPQSVAALLRRCFERDPDRRPRNMLEVAAEFKEIYLQTIGRPYPRPEPGGDAGP